MLGKRLSLKKRPKVGVDHSEDIISNATPSGLVEAGLPTPIPASVPSRPPSPLLCSDEEVAEVGAIPVASASKPEEKESESEESAVEEADPDESPEQLSQEDLKEGNVNAMVSCRPIAAQRVPILNCLTVPLKGVSIDARKPFKLPGGTQYTPLATELKRRKTFGVRMSLCRPLTGTGFKRHVLPALPEFTESVEEGPDEPVVDFGPPPSADDVAGLPPGIEPLVLWSQESAAIDEGADASACEVPATVYPPVVVDPKLTKFLRQHQREGVQFMFDCVMGLRDFDGKGCILADDMGLGKTLQSITLLWTLLCQGLEGKPTVRRALIVCPTSLVKNWSNELGKWLHGKVDHIALSEAARDVVISELNTFLSPRGPPVLIISYETFRIHCQRFHDRENSCDLIICDEAHRLKNDKTLTTQSLAKLACRRRILLSGTPMQNDLEEFFAMVDFTNPGLLGDASQFRKNFESPILIGREPYATEKELEVAAKASQTLSGIVNKFILRRTNTLLSKHLPPKLVQIVCIKLTPLQEAIYRHIMDSKSMLLLLSGNKATGVLTSIMTLKKLCNHPKLVYEAPKGGSRGPAPASDDIASLFPEGFNKEKSSCPWLSGKFEVLSKMLALLRRKEGMRGPFTGDRIVIVSNYTQTLDLISVMCRECQYPVIRLDGSTTPAKRQKLVDQFNDRTRDEFVFLLSSKAGGCGLNLIGGNRLILFDPDWNPATDKQAAARVWRDGQKRKCYVYRFIATGTLEEKVYQRQLSKEGLQTRVVDEKAEVNSLSSEELSDLFALEPGTPSGTHDSLRCMRCIHPEDSEEACPAGYMGVPGASPSAFKAQLTAAAAEAAAAAAIAEEEAAALAALAPAAPAADADVVIIDGEDDFAHTAPVADVVKPVRKGRKRKETAEDVEYKRLFKEVMMKKLPDVPPGTCRKQIGHPAEENLKEWSHHHGVETINDDVLREAGKDWVSFVFGLEVEGMDVSQFQDAKPTAAAGTPRPTAGTATPRPTASRPESEAPAAPPMGGTPHGLTTPASSGGIKRRFAPLHASKAHA